MSPVGKLVVLVDRHLEVLLYAWFWLAAAALSALASEARLGAVGLITVLPFLVAYAVRTRRAP